MAPGTDREAIGYLRGLAEATLESARVRPGQSRGGLGPNTTSVTLITPGGNYPALWIRDFAMSLDCGLVSPDELLPQLLLIARCQNGGRERVLASGAVIPAFAIPDHINFDGRPVFYPGTMSSGEDQGAAPWGPLPPIDDHYYFIHIAHALWRTTRQPAFLNLEIDGQLLLDRLVAAFHAPDTDPATGVVRTTRERRAVGFGFQDSVMLLGALSFATLLKCRAARQMEALCGAVGRRREARAFREIGEQAAAGLRRVFCPPGAADGWLLAATEVGRQPDVWATLFALHLGVLDGAAAGRARAALAAAVGRPGHSVEYQGAVRHVPADRYFLPDRCWEAGGGPAGTYQSGAFWHTATGWLVEALGVVDPELAQDVWQRYLKHLKEGDFRRGGGRGAPWECFGEGLAGAQNPVYLTSVTVPLAVFTARRARGLVPGGARGIQSPA